MASVKNHELIIGIKAELGSSYKSTFDAAIKQLQNCKKEISGLNNDSSFGKLEDNAKDMRDLLVDVGAVAAVKAVFDATEECVEAAMEYEQAMAGARRTIGLTAQETKALGSELLDMTRNIPIAGTELAGIAETAGQLGVAKENVEDFAEVMAKLDTATDLAADSAATKLAQFTNITGEEDYQRLGSTIAALGDETATTASRIVDMSQTLAPTASVAGFSADEILALSTAVSSLGIESQAGSSSMSRLISRIQKAVETGDGLKQYASVANMTAADFHQAWGENAVGALDAFVEGLDKTNTTGQSAIQILSEMGITNVRETKAILGLSSAGDLLTDTIAKANSAWSDNTALNEKAAIMYDTTQSKVQLMKNGLNALEIASGNALNENLSGVYEVVAEIAGAGATLIEEHPAIVKLLTATAVGVGTVTTGLVAYRAAVLAAKAATELATGPFGLLAAGITAAGVALATLAITAPRADSAVRETKGVFEDCAESITKANEEIEGTSDTTEATAMTVGYYVDQLKLLEDQGLNSAEAQEKYKLILDQINTLMPGLNAQINEQTHAVEGGTDALLANADAWKQNALAEAAMTAQKDVMQAWAEAQTKVYENEIELSTLESEHNDLLAKRKAIIDSLPTSYSNGDEYLYASEAAALDDLNYEISENEDRQNDLRRAISIGNEEMKKYEEQVNDAISALEKYKKTTSSASDEQDNFVTSIDELFGGLTELAGAYQEAYKEAENSFQKQWELWDATPEAVDVSVTEIEGKIAGLQSYWEDYQTNFENLSNRQVDGIQAFVSALSDGSIQSAGYLSTLSGLTDEELSSIISSYSELSETYAATKDEVATLASGVEEGLEDFGDKVKETITNMDMSSDAALAAYKTIKSYIDEADKMTGTVRAAYLKIANAAISGLNTGLTTTTQGTSAGTIYLTDIQHNANGTDNAKKGLSWVGEEGPELMWLNGGEKIIPHRESMSLAYGSPSVTYAPTYHISGSNVSEMEDMLQKHDAEFIRTIRREFASDSRNAERMRV